MTTTEQTLPLTVRQLLDEHLDGLERALLTAGISRPQRQAICDDVELQVREMLWQRSQAEPTVDLTRAVLAELDPPEAYLEAVDADTALSTPAIPNGQPRTHILALISALVPVFGVMVLFLPLGRDGGERALVFLTCAEIVAILLGTVALREIRRFPKQWSGIGLAVFGVLALPILVANFLAYASLAPRFYHLLVDEARLVVDSQADRNSEIASIQRGIENTRFKPGTQEPELDDAALPDRTRQLLSKMEERLARLQEMATKREPTSYQRLLVENRAIIKTTSYVAAMGLVGAASLLSFVVAHRRCLPPTAIE